MCDETPVEEITSSDEIPVEQITTSDETPVEEITTHFVPATFISSDFSTCNK
jgi:hypothetical protein